MEKLPFPNDLRTGLKLKSIRDSRCHATRQEKCRKCDGSGKWCNPRNEFDTRTCFACSGTGTHTVKVLGENGKPTWRKLTAGTVGAVISWDYHGTFYASGYNRPHRGNTSVKVRTDDGEVLSFTLEALGFAE